MKYSSQYNMLDYKKLQPEKNAPKRAIFRSAPSTVPRSLPTLHPLCLCLWHVDLRAVGARPSPQHDIPDPPLPKVTPSEKSATA